MSEKYGLTELGKTKSDAASDVPGLRYAIVNYLNERGESTISELADGTNVNSSDIKRKVNQLVGEKWITKSDNDNDDWD
jgi:DNA-binding MarR family transcriptional regulator